jgi:Spy/CpxP family protein refolding chaperone
MKQGKVILGIIVVFLLGVAAGALLDHHVYRHRLPFFHRGGPHALEDAIVQRWSRQLSMDNAQEERLRAIVREAQAEIAPIRRQLRPQIEATLARSDAKIRAILRPEQQKEFEKLLEERKERMEQWNRQEEEPPPLPR